MAVTVHKVNSYENMTQYCLVLYNACFVLLLFQLDFISDEFSNELLKIYHAFPRNEDLPVPKKNQNLRQFINPEQTIKKSTNESLVKKVGKIAQD